MEQNDFLVNIDDLLSKCRDEKTKPYLAEAIDFYKIGAFRAAIVATWIAVVFDFIAKIRELDMIGDKQADKVIKQFEQANLEKDTREAIRLTQEFERTLLDTAREKFELLSGQQHKDLSRLYEDRHRCAHPSMHSLEEPYQPTAELVRYHLRNAVTYFLQEPPVQGVAAEKRIWNDIHSEYFPTTIQEAKEHFDRGPLARARESLLRHIVIGLTKDLLKNQRSPQERQRQYAALGAVLQISSSKDEVPRRGSDILDAELSSIVGSLLDEAWPSVITYLSLVPSAWHALGESEREKAYRFIQGCPLEVVEQVISEALTIPPLKETASKRLPELSVDALSTLLSAKQLPEYISEAIQRWGHADSYEEAKIRTKKLLIPLLSILNGPQISQVVTLFQENSQLYDSFTARDMILDLFKHSRQYAEEVKPAWVELYATFCMVSQGELIQQRLPSLLLLIESAYPNDIDPSKALARKHYLQREAAKKIEDEDVYEF